MNSGGAEDANQKEATVPMETDENDCKESSPAQLHSSQSDAGGRPPHPTPPSSSKQMDIDAGSPTASPTPALKRKESPDGGRSNSESKKQCRARTKEDKLVILKRRIKRYRMLAMHGCGRARCVADNCCADRPNFARMTEAKSSKAALDCLKRSAKFCDDFAHLPLTLDFVRQAHKDHQARVEAGQLKISDPEAEEPGPEDDIELINALASGFAHLEQPHLNNSFRAAADSTTSPEDPNIDLEWLEEVCNEIMEIDGGEGNLVGVFGSEFKRRQAALREALDPLKTKKREELTEEELLLLRRVFILFNCAIFITMDPGAYDTTMWPAVSLINYCVASKGKNSNAMMDTLVAWGFKIWSRERIENLRDTLQQYITIRWEEIFENDRIERIVLDSSMNDTIGPAIRCLDIVWRVEQQRQKEPEDEDGFIPDEDWYNEPISSEFAKGTGVAQYDYKRWRKRVPEEIAISDYPWMLDAGSKAKILLTDSKFQMRESTDRQMRTAIFNRMLRMGPGQMDMRGSLRDMQRQMQPYLLLEVSRESIVSDALNSLLMQNAEDYKKPLKVKFKGEEGIDEGGVRKEFFQLIIGEIFDPMRGIFIQRSGVTRDFWFNRDSHESPAEYELIGILCGLSIYNSVILDIRWPSLVFRKLKDMPMTRADFREYDPEQMANFDKLLEMTEEELEGMDQRFTYEYTFMDEEMIIDLMPKEVEAAEVAWDQGDGKPVDGIDGPLKPALRVTYGGAVRYAIETKKHGDRRKVVLGSRNVIVTCGNVQEFVDRYIDWTLNQSIEKQFNEFKKGFELVCHGPALDLFRWGELELLVCGSPQFDFEALEKASRCQDGFTKESPVIQWMWEVLHSLDETHKRKFLEFATGSDRVPIRGLGDLTLVITKAGGDSKTQLPTSHTCFNHLLLPEYATKELLRERLLKAMEFCKGFGLK